MHCFPASYVLVIIAWVGDCRNFYGISVKPNFQNQNFFFFFFFFNSISTYIQCATRRLSLCNIANMAFRHFMALPTAKPPSSFEHA